jgi:hypothetical protein
MLQLAVADMKKAYTDAIALTPEYTNEGSAGAIGGLTLLPGIHKWDAFVSVAGTVYIKGTPDDVFIFQVTAYLSMAYEAKMVLVEAVEGGGKPLAANVFWAVGGYLAPAGRARLEGTFMVKAYASFGAGALLNGRLWGQGAITLGSNKINMGPGSDRRALAQEADTADIGEQQAAGFDQTKTTADAIIGASARKQARALALGLGLGFGLGLLLIGAGAFGFVLYRRRKYSRDKNDSNPHASPVPQAPQPRPAGPVRRRSSVGVMPIIIEQASLPSNYCTNLH